VLLRHVAHAPVNAPLFVVHRIDKETSGLVVFARTWLAQRHLAGLFRRHEVARSYLAICDGYLARERVTFESHLVANRGDGLRGSAKQAGLGVRAVTHVETLERLGGAASLLRCTLETGKTHQIRIHLAEAGHPLLGEPVYARHHAQPMSAAPRLMLHAEKLAFTHPARVTETVAWTRDPPEDFAGVLAALRDAR
jgi:23S rRNA pseudouridine1911/1915/1917 synthase